MNFSIFNNKILLFLGFATLTFLGNIQQTPALPEKFVYLEDIDASIIQNMRYTTDQNFLGKIVPGYYKPSVVCTKVAAEQLKQVQQDLKTQGYQLVVYDGYRPQQAVDAFMVWSHDVNDQKVKEYYYPTINKENVFKLGYVAEKSSHSRGSTFDVTLLPLNHYLKPIDSQKRCLQNNESIPFLDDNTFDMGSSFDLFHPVSHHDTTLITTEQLQNRQLLRQVMKKHGFKDYQEEWWHYTLENEPYPQTYFDFIVQ